MRIIFFVLVLLCFFSCKEKSPTALPATTTASCNALQDTRLTISFLPDTTTSDFFKLIRFLIAKGEVKAGSNKKQIDTLTERDILLLKVICEDKDYNAQIEYWQLKDIYSISCSFDLKKELYGKNDLYYGFRIQQLNFVSEAEQQKAYIKIKEIGWGDPLKKWNDYIIIPGIKRIYIVTTGLAGAESLKRRYCDVIRKEWANKY